MCFQVAAERVKCIGWTDRVRKGIPNHWCSCMEGARTESKVSARDLQEVRRKRWPENGSFRWFGFWLCVHFFSTRPSLFVSQLFSCVFSVYDYNTTFSFNSWLLYTRTGKLENILGTMTASIAHTVTALPKARGHSVGIVWLAIVLRWLTGSKDAIATKTTTTASQRFDKDRER